MSIKLYSQFHVPILLSRTIPERFKPQLLAQAEKWAAEDEENEFLFQQITGRGFTIHFQSLFLRKRAVYYIESPATICFQASLHRTLQFALSGFENRINIYHRRFNVLFSPSMHFMYESDKSGSSFLSCELWLSHELLQSFADGNDVATAFFRDIQKGRPTKLFEHSQYSGVELMCLIDLLIQHSQESIADADRLDVYAVSILEHAFRARKSGKRINLKPEILRGIYEAVDIINEMEDLQSQINLAAGIAEVSPHELTKEVFKSKMRVDCDNWTVEDLAAFAGMSTYAFQKAFKELYNCTVKEYVRQLTWQSALNMLISRSTNLKRIAAFTGFHTQRSFSRAFKQRFGKTPVEYAQEFEEKLKKYKKSVYRNPGENLEIDPQGR